MSEERRSCSQDAENKYLERQITRRFQIAKEGRKYEIDKFWQRSSFFWIFIAAAFVGFAKISEDATRLCIACFGLVSSLAWTLQNRGSKYWQEAWETKVERYEISALGERVFKTEKRQRKGLWGGWKFSVSKLTIFLSDFVTILWLGLAFHSSRLALMFEQLHRDCLYGATFLGTVLYCLVMGICSRKTADK